MRTGDDAGYTTPEAGDGDGFDDDAIDVATGLDQDLEDAADTDDAEGYVPTVDQLEQVEAGITFDDPEEITMLDGGMDDPDGAGGPSPSASIRSPDDEGWDLDAPEV